MKTKNRVLAVLMVFVMILTCVPASLASGLIPADEYLAQQNQQNPEAVAPEEETGEDNEGSDEVESVQVGNNLNMVDLAYAGNTSAIGLHGTMATNPADAYQALSELPLQRALGSSSPNGALAQGVVNTLKVGSPMPMRGGNGEIEGLPEGLPDLTGVPRQLDGSNIESIEIRWMTPDTVANGVEGYELAKDDDTLLYIKPSGDNKQSVRLRINYSLSGEHNYEPGDVNITIPASMFQTRSGAPYGTINIPYPEDPSTKNDFNWRLVDDVYVLTNTKRMSAATRGYVEIGFYDLYPHAIADMAASKPFVATIEVLTHKGNLIGLTSNPIYASIDTEARVVAANKQQYDRTKIVTAAEVPSSAKKDPITGEADNEEYYVEVTWYTWAHRTANTEYTITLQDIMPAQYNGRFGTLSGYNLLGVGQTADWDNIDNPTRYGSKDYLIGSANDGHVLTHAQQSTQTYKDAPTQSTLVVGDLYQTGYTDEVSGVYSTDDARVLTIPRFYDGYISDRDTSNQLIKTYYPLSQFEEGKTYTFINTVVYTLIERDPAQGEDPKLETVVVKSAPLNWTFERPRWMNPIGHFMVYKNGNDNVQNNFITHKNSWTRSDYLLHDDGYYGMYHTALNDLLDGLEPEISYTINSLGYIMPWTLNAEIPVDQNGDSSDGEKPARMKKSYFQRAVDFVTTDKGLSWARHGRTLYEGDDYDYVAVQINGIQVWDGVPKNINPDGSFEALYAGDGTFEYRTDRNYAHYPTIYVEEQHGENWTRVGAVSWDPSTGAMITRALPSNTILNDNKVPISESATCVRTVTTTNRAGLTYDARIFVQLHNTDAMKEVVEASFVNNYAPSLSMWNTTVMECGYSTEYEVDTTQVPAGIADPDLWSDYYVLKPITGETPEKSEIVSIEKDGYDVLRGYTTDLYVIPSKSGNYSIQAGDVNYEDRYVTVHFNASVQERSYIADRVTYETARDRGSIITERSGVWYDLLPKGFTPVISTVKLRPDDLITNIRLYPNYKNSGRTLMKVSAELVPVTTSYTQNDVTYYGDKITISFDARYNFDDMVAYGKEPHNVIAFESGNDSIGSVENYMGELGDLSTNNNVATAKAFDTRDSDEGRERETMKDLHRTRTTPSFLYAGALVKLDFESAARVSLSKDVMVNNDGLWGDGVYYDYNNGTYNEVIRDANKKIVYTGGVYKYRLRMQPADGTISKDMILYDSLENFYAGNIDPETGKYPNDQVDYDAPRWYGTLERVDVSQIEEMGGAPVLYYSTVSNLQLADETDPEKGNPINMNLADSNIWVNASDYTGSLADVKAIAVDASKAADGSDFSLDGENNEATQIVIHMRAPDGDAALTALQAKPTEQQIADGFDWGESANAYNNAFLTATLIDKNNENEPDYNSFVRKDYTKVGLAEYAVVVDKIWDDDDNRDGKRPEEPITFTLYRNEEPTGLTQVLQPGETEVKFANLPYCDADGIVYSYTVTESDVPGYTRSIGSTDDSGHIVVRNVHPPEKVSISGDKIWENDEEEDRPESLIVILYADGEFLTQKTVYPTGDGSWAYSFDDMYRYKRVNGVTSEIVYSVEEKLVSKAGKSYIPSYAEPVIDADGNVRIDITNTRHPYGPLYVSKTVQNVTPVSADISFDFTFVLKHSEENGGAPVMEPIAYQIIETGNPENVISEGTMVCDDTISIKGGQTIYIPEVPEYVNYIIYEDSKDGFTAVGRSSESGQITPNAESHADFTNRYAAQGRFQMKASKRLNNRKLTAYQFRFELLDQNGQLIRTASNSRVASEDDVHYLDITDQQVGTDQEPPVEYSVADVTFGALRYTQADLVEVDASTLEPVLDGNGEPIPVSSREFLYYVHEVDTGKGGYTYDDSWYEVRALVTDAGNGTLDVTSSVKKMVFSGDEKPVATEDIVAGSDWMPEYQTEDIADIPQFVNEYKAEGELTLRAWKDLKGRELLDNEFAFDLLSDEIDDEEQPVVLQTKKTTANGSVVFDPIKFTEKDIGLTYYFILREKIPVQEREGEVTPSEGDYSETDYTAYIDPTVIYTKDVFGYSVTVFDNGDGTLSFETGLLTPEVEEENVGTDEEPDMQPSQNVVYKEGKAVFVMVQVAGEDTPDDESDDVWEFAEGALPVFTNKLKPGSLSVSKYVQDDTGNADPNQEFTFRVVLIGEDVTDDLITEYELQPADPDKNPLNTNP